MWPGNLLHRHLCVPLAAPARQLYLAPSEPILLSGCANGTGPSDTLTTIGPEFSYRILTVNIQQPTAYPDHSHYAAAMQKEWNLML